MNWWPTVWLAAPLLTLFLEASHSDLATRKVPNRLIVLYLGVAVVAQGVVALCWALGVDGADLPLKVGLGRYLLIWLVNGLMGFGVALGLWWLGFWPAGEAKLFTVAGLLFPLWWIKHGLSSQFLGLALLHNVFLVVFFYVLAEIPWRLWRWRADRPGFPREEKAPKTWRELARTGVGIVVIFLFARLVRLEIMGGAHLLMKDTSLLYLALVFLFHEVSGVFSRPWVMALGAAVLAGFAGHALWLGAAERLWWLVNLSGYALTIIGVRLAYDHYAKVMNVRPVAVDDLTQGMVLSGHTQRLVMADRGFFEENIERFYADGLTHFQAENLKRWHGETGKLGEGVWVAHTTPIAPLMGLGFLVSALAQGVLPLPVIWRWLMGG